MYRAAKTGDDEQDAIAIVVNKLNQRFRVRQKFRLDARKLCAPR